MTEGIVSSYRRIPEIRTTDEKMFIDQVQVSTPISPGNSGGPLFTATGKLIGVSTWIRNEATSQNLNFAITSGELKRFVDSISKFSTRAEINKSYKERSLARTKKLEQKYIDPIFAVFKHNEKLNKWDKKIPDTVKNITFEGFKYNYHIPLLFGDKKKCKLSRTTKNLKQYKCDVSNYHQYRVEVWKNDTKIDIQKRWHGKTIKPVPLLILASLKKSSSWKTEQHKLTENNLKFLHYFQNLPYKCKRYTKCKLYNHSTAIWYNRSYSGKPTNGQ